MPNGTTAIHPRNLPWHPSAVLVPQVSLQVQEVYPFHDGWNVTCFVILLLFILAVVSLAAVAALYELLDWKCCAKGKTHDQLQEEELQEEELQEVALQEVALQDEELQDEELQDEELEDEELQDEELQDEEPAGFGELRTSIYREPESYTEVV